ncbi:MAG: DUF503 domain-containing protein [Turicibacter sp.]|nr:DUF503 domain-containing protein [Turicibacter sp.]
MFTKSAKLTFYLQQSQSLKDKRQIRRSIIQKTRNKFNVSAAEIATQDNHKMLTIGIATVSGEVAHLENSLDEIIRYMANNANAELSDVVIFDGLET